MFDEYVRTGRVPVGRLAPWPDDLVSAEELSPEVWVATVVGQDWEPMPPDCQVRLGGMVSYSEGASVVRRRLAGFDAP
ncbi:hypothetical protein BH18ACT1_BH18ACT1_09690 [soil metagenome]